MTNLTLDSWVNLLMYFLSFDDLQRAGAVIVEPAHVVYELTSLEFASQRCFFDHARLTPARPRMRRCAKLSRLPV